MHRDVADVYYSLLTIHRSRGNTSLASFALTSSVNYYLPTMLSAPSIQEGQDLSPIAFFLFLAVLVLTL